MTPISFILCTYGVLHTIKSMDSGLKFQWDAGNKPKVAAHNLTPEEVEEAMDNDALYQHLQWAENEERELYYGETNSGRMLAVVVTWRGGHIRVCTAYPLDTSQKQDYMQQRTEQSA